MEIILLLAGVLIGGAAGWFAARSRFLSESQGAAASVTILQQQVQEFNKKLESEHAKVIELTDKLAESRSDTKHVEEKRKELESIHTKLTSEFKNLANEIFEEKNKKSKENLGEILNPLKEKIQEFEKKVEESHKENLMNNSALKQELLNLKDLNLQMSKEAESLTRALKGDNKAQGNWGEFILERILEKSGLRKGEEYEMQESHTTEEGRRYQPDVVVKLPDNKNLIIDSKVSLTAYERYVSDDNEEEKSLVLKQHILSLRNHIKGLSEKNYQKLYNIGGLDFVLLFIPIEPAFSLAVQNDQQIFLDAYDKNIVMVSPSTLIATLRTIASIWKNENQNRNALEIARQGGDLYDKFVNFTNDLIKVGEQLKTTKKSYDDAMSKLSDGKGNLIGRVHKLKELGAKTSKQLDARLVDRALDEDELSE
ncbi:MAG: DNA recombination protein RmuC [Cyclobacteriaceae bacterium]|nr:DNA recombination protein RmuC [Cyclobacteriaceae bacterium]